MRILLAIVGLLFRMLRRSNGLHARPLTADGPERPRTRTHFPRHAADRAPRTDRADLDALFALSCPAPPRGTTLVRGDELDEVRRDLTPLVRAWLAQQHRAEVAAR